MNRTQASGVHHHEFSDHLFDPIDMIDMGQQVHKISRCACGLRQIEVYTFDHEIYEEGKDPQ
ncbi:MAG: hypothetical protein HGA87_01885 [Desulfobulbaceae bacterium]|nr:hypothetical protein [Desulfobulbaceae bacterium]